MKNFTLISLTLFIFALITGCQSDREVLSTATYTAEELNILSSRLHIPEVPFSYSFGNTDAEHKVDHIGTLGRVLFYDKNLSADGSVSCASCHQQSLAFADNKDFSPGVNGNTTHRNSIALGALRNFGVHYDPAVNGVSTPGLFWDERATSIKEQLKQTISNPNEMGMELQDIVDLVNSTDYYRVLHQKAFAETAVTEDHILEAIETFINSISAVNTKFENEMLSDLNFINGDYVTGSSEHEKGLRLFVNNCSSCHQVNTQLLNEGMESESITVANNGLPNLGDDLGVYEYTQDEADIGKFKIPGLHNIALTAPYMHDGRFKTLEEVVDFYNAGIEWNDNLHSALRSGNEAKRLNLNKEDKMALVNFLKLLTDDSLTKEEKWSNPFLE